MSKAKSKKLKKPRTTDELYYALTSDERKTFLRMEYIITAKKIETNNRKVRP